jgi:hypothetical protein
MQPRSAGQGPEGIEPSRRAAEMSLAHSPSSSAMLAPDRLPDRMVLALELDPEREHRPGRVIPLGCRATAIERMAHGVATVQR